MGSCGPRYYSTITPGTVLIITSPIYYYRESEPGRIGMHPSMGDYALLHPVTNFGIFDPRSLNDPDWDPGPSCGYQP